MRFHPKMILLVSIGLGFVAFSLASATLTNARKSPSGIRIVTAIRDLGVGDVITKEDIDLIVAPKNIDFKTVYRKPASVMERTVRNPLKRGEPIRQFDLLQPGDNLSSLIPDGYRATTMSLPLPTETTNFLKFGSRVDILYSDTTKKNFETITIMKNIMVLKATLGKKSAGKQITNVTLAIKPEGVEALSYATKKGKIDIVSRPSNDRTKEEVYVHPLDVLSKSGFSMLNVGPKSEIELIRGVKKETVKL